MSDAAPLRSALGKETRTLPPRTPVLCHAFQTRPLRIGDRRRPHNPAPRRLRLVLGRGKLAVALRHMSQLSETPAGTRGQGLPF